jgi:excisionase family DNA binding protein
VRKHWRFFVVREELLKCVSVNEAAELLGVVPLTIRRLIKDCKLRAVHVGRRVMIRVSDLEAFLAANEVA